MIHRPSRSIPCGLVAALLLQVGCAASRVPPKLDPSTRATLGTVAVSWVDEPPRVTVYSTHSAGQGAAAGAGAGLKAGIPLLAIGGAAPQTAVVGVAGLGISLAGALIGAPIGAIVGATKAPPRAELRRVTAAFADHVAPLDVGGCIGGHVHQTLRRATSTWSILAPDAAPGTTARDRALVDQGVGTLVEIGALALEVSGPFGTHPEGDVILTAPVRLVRVADGTVLLAHELRWRGTRESAWPIDTVDFAAAIERGCQRVALDVVEILGISRGGAEAPTSDDALERDRPE